MSSIYYVCMEYMVLFRIISARLTIASQERIYIDIPIKPIC